MFIVPVIPPTLRSPYTVPLFTDLVITPSVFFAFSAVEISSIWLSSLVTSCAVSFTVLPILLICEEMVLILSEIFCICSSRTFTIPWISPVILPVPSWSDTFFTKSSAVSLESAIVLLMSLRLSLMISHCSSIASFWESDKILSSPWMSFILLRALSILSKYSLVSGLSCIESDTSFKESDNTSASSLYWLVMLSA